VRYRTAIDKGESGGGGVVVSQQVPREIPDPIKREVRQRCGFGCVMCGMPLYEYDHLLGFAETQRHVADEITLLCDQHHKEKTNGLLPPEAIARANEHPYNLREGVSKPYDLHYSGNECQLDIGANIFTVENAGMGTILVPIIIDGIAPIVFALTEDHLLLNVILFDELNRLVLRIQENELVFSIDPWDIELTGRNLVLRAGHGDIFLDITFVVPNTIRLNRGRLLYNGVEILIAPELFRITNNGNLFTGARITNMNLGFVLGVVDPPPPHKCAFRMPDLNRYLGPSPGSGHATARKAIRKAEEEARKAEQEHIEMAEQEQHIEIQELIRRAGEWPRKSVKGESPYP
jgi:hypothetical protein